MNNRSLRSENVSLVCLLIWAGIILLFPGRELDAQENAWVDTTEVQQVAERKFLNLERNQTIHRFRGDHVVQKDEVINGHVVIVKGNLDVYGTINGDVLVIGGDVRVRNDGWVNGDITSLGGKVVVEQDGHVLGNMLETHASNLMFTHVSSHRSRWRALWEEPGDWHTDTHADAEKLVFRYNRVEGVFLGINMRQPWRRTRYFSLYGFGGYGFKNKAWRYELGIRRWFIDPYDYRLEIGFDIHDLTDTKDLWRTSYLENSLAAFLFREDYHDYFRRYGYRVYVAQNLGSRAFLKLEYRDDDYESMSNVTNWSLFGGKKVFRENPPLGIYEGKYQTLIARFNWDRRKGYHYHQRGWWLNLEAEIAPESWKNTTIFERYLLELRTYIRLTPDENLNARVLVGASQGDLPIQKNFELGGIGTLRGFPYKAFVGNQMILGNVEYVVSNDLLGFPFPDGWNLILFGDVGAVWRSNPDQKLDEIWKNLHRDRLKSNIGFAIASRDGDFRVNIARPIRSSRQDIIVTVRIQQPF
ncbi:MAG: BamA/TamA family outer membrane protein [Calditrichaeota bacterium]|nr:BamA/TamA family outer membrane protein [Calditrichota bacterium]